jgi:predicted dehydrogenase
MSTEFNLAVIGAGMWGKAHIDMFQKDGRAQISWVCDANLAVAEAAASKFGVKRATQSVEEVLEDQSVQAVVVASPPFTHIPIGLEVLRAGKHLLIEKPMAVNPDESALLVAEVNQHPELVVLEGSCRHARLNPKFRFVRSMIDSGKLGQVYHIHHSQLSQGTFVEYNPHGAWAMNKRFAGGGPFLDWGVYDLSFHLGILGDRYSLESVHAFTKTGLRDLSAKAPVVDVEMHGAAFLEFDNGLTYYYERGAGVHGETRNETRIYGTLGGLHFSYTTWESNEIQFFTGIGEPCSETLPVDMSGHAEHDNIPFVAHFLDCLEGKAQPLMPVSLADRHLNILFRILQS